MLFTLAKKSLMHRKTTALLTVFSIAMSVFVLLGIEHVRTQTKYNFTRTLSDTDFVVGARTGDINLLLYSVFRMGSATNNMSWHSYQQISQSPQVAWTIPLSLGDSHRGYRVLGTTSDYFTHYKFAQKQPLRFAQGTRFNGLLDVVIGANVADKLGYSIGSSLVLEHGLGQHSFTVHDQHPFRVVGILAPTGTPVDNTLHVSLQAIEAIHTHVPATQKQNNADIDSAELQPTQITAMLVGLKQKIHTFSMQRAINSYGKEPLMAILPGATLAKLWGMFGSIETVLFLISLLVLVSALIGMSTMLMSSLRERNRELSILRAIGAPPVFSLLLVQLEVCILVVGGVVLAVVMLGISLFSLQNLLIEHYGLYISLNFFTINTLMLTGTIVVLALIIGFIPAYLAYKKSLQQGLQAP